MVASVILPRILRIGAGASEQLADVLATLGLSRPFIVTDAFLVQSGMLAPLQARLEMQGMRPRVFSGTVSDPTIASIEAGLGVLREGAHDCVIGFGGGSPLDSAKAIAMLAVHGGSMADYKVPHVQDKPGLPVIAIPTTAGTGSEATRVCVITDSDTDEKMLCAGLAYMPVAALVDYRLTFGKPRRLTADTGIDSLTHAIEAYVSRRANPFADGFALAAMRLIAPNIRTACNDPGNAAAREAMMLGALNGGIAFSNSSVALVHGMSRPIGAHFHVPHGLSNAMLLPAVTAWSSPAAMARYAECARAMGVASESVGDDVAVAHLIAELQQLNRDLDVPGPAEYGIERDRWQELIPLMCEQAEASGSPANNPRSPSNAEMAALYAQIYPA